MTVAGRRACRETVGQRTGEQHTMSTSISSSSGTINIGGLASGVQWRDLVDQLAAVQTAQQVTPLQTQVSDAEKRKTAWNSSRRSSRNYRTRAMP